MSWQKIKSDFPILKRQINGHDLVYLDNAATSQKPETVISAISDYYRHHNANVHRGVHTLSDESTHLFEKSRQTIARFLGARPEELILVRNTTEALNGVAYGWADQHLHEGDTILTTLMEHHSNLVTWQEAARRNKVHLEFVNLTSDGQLDWDHLTHQLKQKSVKLVALTHVSNTLGTLNPITKLVKLIRHQAPQAKICLDAAQSAPHLKLDFAQLGVDFLAFSGHKMLGPMGSGGLLVKRDLLQTQEFRPWLFGGGMIAEVTTRQTRFTDDLNEKFVAGTPDVASTVGLAAACDYLSALGMKAVEEHGQDLVEYALTQLKNIKAVEIVGPLDVGSRMGSVAFLYQGVHAHDVAQILDSQGIAVRSGHHCTMPLHQHFGWQATVRASFQVYNSRADVDQLIQALSVVKKTFT